MGDQERLNGWKKGQAGVEIQNMSQMLIPARLSKSFFGVSLCIWWEVHLFHMSAKWTNTLATGVPLLLVLVCASVI